MDYVVANSVKKKFNLFDKQFSRDALKLIRCNPAKALSIFSNNEKEIKWIIERYHYHQRIQRNREIPRNIIFYKIINEIYPGFSWQVTPNGTVIKHKIDGIQASLLSYLFNNVPCAAVSRETLLPQNIHTMLGSLFDEHKIKVIHPDYTIFEKWIEKGLAGEKLTIISPVCPDYAAERINDDAHQQTLSTKTIRHRFTFDGLGEEMGVTATYLLQVLPLFKSLLTDQMNIDVECVVAYGNFEGYSAQNLQRLNITEKEFQKRIKASVRYLNKKAPQNTYAVAFDEIVGGKTGWLEMLAFAQERVDAKIAKDKHFQHQLSKTANARGGLYDRWCVRNDDPDRYMKMIIPQVMEYAAMGVCIKKSAFENPLILGADDHKMGKFYHLLTALPVVYLPRIYE